MPFRYCGAGTLQLKNMHQATPYKAILPGLALGMICLVGLLSPAQAAKPVKAGKIQVAEKERLVLMPLRLGEEDQKLQGAMETALIEGLQQKYEVFSGEQVAKKAREIFMKESKNTAHKECDETRCLQGIAESFQSELLAIANITKEGGGYFLALSIRNLYDNKDVYSKSLPCRGCDQFQVIDKLKELVGTPTNEAPDSKSTPNDAESELWGEVQKGNSKEDYQAYISQYPRGKYLALAKSRIRKLDEQTDTERSQQDKLAWESANSTATVASYQNYLDSYPSGQFATLAHARMDKLKRDAAQVQPRQEAETKSPAPTPTQPLSYAASAGDSKTIATVNGAAIPQLRLDLRIKVAAEQGQKDSPELRKTIRDDLINLEVIAQEAVKLRLGPPIEVSKSFIDTPIGQQNILAQQSALAGAFFQDYAKRHPVTEEALLQEYENLKSRIGNKEYKVAHILVASENEAIAIATELKKGRSFDKIAKEKSLDPGSSKQGGDLGWNPPSSYVAPFAEAFQKLAKGHVSSPVQTQFGWHIIKLEDVRDLKLPAFQEVKANLEKRQQQQALQEAINSLRAKARID